MAAVDVATAGLAGALAAHVAGRMSAKAALNRGGSLKRGKQTIRAVEAVVGDNVVLGHNVKSAGRTVVSAGKEISDQAPQTIPLNPQELVVFVADGMKQGIKAAGKTARTAAFEGGGAAAGDHSARGGGAASGDPLINFFSEQDTSLSLSKRERLLEVVHARDGLRPLLRDDAEVAAEGMQAIKEGLDQQIAQIKGQHSNQSRFAWMRFLSQSALGSLDASQAKQVGLDAPAGDERITDTRGANIAPQEGQAPRKFDGVLDIEFSANYDHPEQSVEIRQASYSVPGNSGR